MSFYMIFQHFIIKFLNIEKNCNLCTVSPFPSILSLKLRVNWDSWIYRFCLSQKLKKFSHYFFKLFLGGLIFSFLLLMNSKNSVLDLLILSHKFLRPYSLFSIHLFLFCRLYNFSLFVIKLNTCFVISNLLLNSSIKYFIEYFSVLEFPIWFFFLVSVFLL